jgi:hypothetical protein
LELSNQSLEQALSLDWSTNQWSERGEDESPFSLRVLERRSHEKGALYSLFGQ